METISKLQMINWIQQCTQGSKYIIDLGCGCNSRVRFINTAKIYTIGIDLSEKYLKMEKHLKEKILGDMCDFDKLIDKRYYDCALLIDSLEHVEKEKGVNLLKKLKKFFNTIVIITPEGENIQNKDLLGFGEDEFQTHKSFWYANDFVTLGFDFAYIHNYHNQSNNYTTENPTGCFLAIWKKDYTNRHLVPTIKRRGKYV